MKLLRCDGRVLEVRDVGPVLLRVRAREIPVKGDPWRIVEDDEARRAVREVLATGLYVREVPS